MRIVPLLVLVLASSVALTGCTQGDPGDDEDFGAPTCPSWTRGLNRQVIDGNLMITNQTTMPDLDRWDFTEPGDTGSGLGSPYGGFQGRPLDFMTLDFHDQRKGEGQDEQTFRIFDAEAKVTFYAERDGQLGEPMEAYEEGRPETAKHEWTFRSEPGKLLIQNITWKIELAKPDQEPDPHGVYVHWEMVPNLDNDIDTPSIVLMRYAPQFWYRACWSDGRTATL